MVDYNIVKNCKICMKRFVVKKVEAKRYFCDACQSKMRKDVKK